MFRRWRNKLKWAPFEFFAPSPLMLVRSWLHPFKGHCEQKAMRDTGLFMSLVIHYWIGDVQDCQVVSASEMTYIVLSGELNSTHSLFFCRFLENLMVQQDHKKILGETEDRYYAYVIQLIVHRLQTLSSNDGVYKVKQRTMTVRTHHH